MNNSVVKICNLIVKKIYVIQYEILYNLQNYGIKKCTCSNHTTLYFLWHYLCFLSLTMVKEYTQYSLADDAKGYVCICRHGKTEYAFLLHLHKITKILFIRDENKIVVIHKRHKIFVLYNWVCELKSQITVFTYLYDFKMVQENNQTPTVNAINLILYLFLPK